MMGFYILTIIFLTLQTISSQSDYNNIDYDFTGGSPCPQNEDITGYSDLITLNQDMYLNALDVLLKDQVPESEYLYILCPNTTYDINEASKSANLHESIAIFLNNTILQCGTDEKFHHGTCVVSGGPVQIVFTPVLATRDVVIKGITFKGSKGYGVAAYGHPSSDATFIDCTWIENEAMYLVSIYYKPWEYNKKNNDNDRYLQGYDEMHYNTLTNIRQLPISSQRYGMRGDNSRKLLGYAAMSVELIKCTFKNNVLTNEAINNQGGHLKLIETTFINNIVQFAVVTVAYGGQLSIEQNTHFQENISPFVPVFIDSDSYLNLNIDNTGKLNTGIACTEGIFLENDNSYCIEGGKCDGECCPFGDESCDRYESPEDVKEMQPDAPTNDIEMASSSAVNDEEYQLDSFTAPQNANVTYKDQRKTVTALSVIVGLLAAALVVMFGLFVFMKGRQHARLGMDPDNVLD